jgi:hypothetical protein
LGIIREAIAAGETYLEAAFLADVPYGRLMWRKRLGEIDDIRRGQGARESQECRSCRRDPTFEEIRRRRLLIRSRWSADTESSRRVRTQDFGGIWEFDEDSGMAVASQLPGGASVRFVRGDDWGETFDFSFDATGYTWSASLYSLFTGANVVSPAITVVSASAGQVALALTDAQTAALQAGTYGLRVTWNAPGDVVRRAAEGICEVMP